MNVIHFLLWLQKVSDLDSRNCYSVSVEYFMILFKVLKMTVVLYILVLFKSQIKMMYKMEATVNIFQSYGNVTPCGHPLIPAIIHVP